MGVPYDVEASQSGSMSVSFGGCKEKSGVIEGRSSFLKKRSKKL